MSHGSGTLQVLLTRPLTPGRDRAGLFDTTYTVKLCTLRQRERSRFIEPALRSVSVKPSGLLAFHLEWTPVHTTLYCPEQSARFFSNSPSPFGLDVARLGEPLSMFPTWRYTQMPS